MIVQLEFTELIEELNLEFEQVYNISDGGYERGYEAGYEKGNTEGMRQGYESGKKEGYEQGQQEGFEKGYTDGLAARTYETWTITYVDDTVEEKEVALL